MIVTSEPKRLKIDANSQPMIPPPRMTRRRGTSVCASRPVESTHRSDSSPGNRRTERERPGRDHRRAEARRPRRPRPRSCSRRLNVPEPFTHSTPFALKRPATPLRHLPDDPRFHSFAAPKSSRGSLDADAELAERRRWPDAGTAPSAPTPSSGCSRCAGTCRRARAPSRCTRPSRRAARADRGGVSAGASAQNGNVTSISLSSILVYRRRGWRASRQEDELAELPARGERVVGGLDLGERERLARPARSPAGGEQRKRRDGRAAGRRAPSPRARRERRVEVDPPRARTAAESISARAPGARPDHDEPAAGARAGRSSASGRRRPARGSRRTRRRRSVAGDGAPSRDTAVARPGGDRAPLAPELHRGDPHAARCALDEQPLAAGSRPGRTGRRARSRRPRRSRRPGGQRAARARERVPLVHRCQLALAPAAGGPQSTQSPSTKSRTPRPQGDHLAGALETPGCRAELPAAPDNNQRALPRWST